MLHIGFSRLYLGVHSVADLGGGLVGGALSVLIFTRLLEPLDAAAVAAVGTHPLAGGAALIVGCVAPLVLCYPDVRSENTAWSESVLFAAVCVEINVFRFLQSFFFFSS